MSGRAWSVSAWPTPPRPIVHEPFAMGPASSVLSGGGAVDDDLRRNQEGINQSACSDSRTSGGQAPRHSLFSICYMMSSVDEVIYQPRVCNRQGEGDDDAFYFNLVSSS